MRIIHFLFLAVLVACQQQVEPKKDNGIDGQLNTKNESLRVEKFFEFDNLSEEVKNELSEDWWLGKCSVKSIDFIHDGIILGLHDEDYLKYMIATPEKVVISYHQLFGTDGRTIILDKKTGQLKETEITLFATGLVDKDVLKVEREYYDDLDPNDPNYQGRIFENGTYNLVTGKYIKIK